MSKKETKNIQELIRKPELYLGIATLIVVGIFIVKATYKPVVKVATKIAISPTAALKPSITVSPTKNDEQKQVIVKKIEVKKDIKQIKKFADTGAVDVLVAEGDNFWKIAEKICGRGELADMIKENTGYSEKSLQPGDILSISCD